MILPFLDEEVLYSQYRFAEPWNSMHNRALNDEMPAVYHCPSDFPGERWQTSYAMIVGPHAISDGPTPRRKSDIKDGPSNTIMVVDAGGLGIDWMEPRDLNTDKMTFRTRAAEKDLRLETCEIFCCHGAVANVLYCDGSVGTLSNESVSIEKLKTLMTIDGTDAVPAER